MKKRVIVILTVIMLLFIRVSSADGFSSDADAIEAAARSVLMLEVYDTGNELIGIASGFVAFDNRTVVTNYHVIDDAAMIVGNSDNGYKYYITDVLCADEKYDIAILQMDAPSDMIPLELYADDQLKPGASVVAIGSPEGCLNTVSTGIISEVYELGEEPSIRISALISYGSSGGALFNDSGHVIGVTSAGNGDTQDMNFAVHAGIVKAMYQAWDGKTVYALGKQPVTAELDYTGVKQ